MGRDRNFCPHSGAILATILARRGPIRPSRSPLTAVPRKQGRVGRGRLTSIRPGRIEPNLAVGGYVADI